MAIFAVGGMAALPFYHAPAAVDLPVVKAAVTAEFHPAASVALQIPANEIEQELSPSPSNTALSELQHDTRTVTPKRVSNERDSPVPPVISSEFPAGSQGVPPSIVDPARTISKRIVPSQPVIDDEIDGDGPRVHRIRDGDTLGKIAERYLKNSKRWIEILDANRTLLRDPELLPVGKELKIPATHSARSSPGESSAKPSATPENPADEPLTRLVPIR